jgi:hypothetical protein
VRVKQSSETGRLWRPRHLPTVGCGGVLGRLRLVEALQPAGTGPPGRFVAARLDGRSPNPPVACRSDPDRWSSSPPLWQKPGAPRVSCGWFPTRGRGPSCRIRRALRGDRAACTCSPSIRRVRPPGLWTKETARFRGRFQSGPIRTGRGTCHERASAVRAAGGADTMRLRPNLCADSYGQVPRHADPTRQGQYNHTGVLKAS